MKIDLCGYEVQVSFIDYFRVKRRPWRANVRRDGRVYFQTNVNDGGKQTTLLLHRFILGASHGDGTTVDHADRDTLNNTRGNLRFVTPTENAANQRRLAKSKTSKFKGVSWDATKELWYAKIGAHGKQLNLGRYTRQIDAARAYDAAAVKLFGKYAATNQTLFGI